MEPSRSKPYIPLVCPFLEKCEENVTEPHAEHICYGEWRACEKLPKEVLDEYQVLKKPRDWQFEE